eukprot:scpid77128/ scgid5264/ 
MDEEKDVSGGSALDREAAVRQEIRLLQEQHASAMKEEITRLEKAASLDAGGSEANRESLLDREVAMRQEIRALQEQRATVMKDEISRLAQTNELHVAKSQLMQAQLQQATQEAAMCRQRTTRANQELKSCQEKLLDTEENARQERLLFEDAEQQLKEAVTKNGSLMLKLKRAETERDEQQKLAKKRLKELESSKHECRCLLCPVHAELLQQLASVKTTSGHSDSPATIATLRGEVQMVSQELGQSRKWVVEQLKSIEDDMETAKVIYSLYNALSLVRNWVQQTPIYCKPSKFS